MSAKPTIRDVAREAGVAPATASLALRNDPRLRQSTRDEVHRAAQKLGYQPNAVVSQLLAQLRASRTPKYQATLGLINASENSGILSQIRTFREWVDGVRERAAKLGYGVNEFWLKEKGMTPQRLAGIFHAQNIRGVIVAACLRNGHLPPGFEEIYTECASVMLGVRGWQPSVHRVCNDQFDTVRRAFDEALKRGYERPGLVMNENLDDLIEGRFTGGFLNAQRLLPARQQVPPFYYRSALDVPLDVRIGTPAVLQKFQQWHERYRPDVLFCLHPEIRAWVEGLGLQAPRDVGLIHLDWNEDTPAWAGMQQTNQLIGAAGVDLLIGQLHRNELGIPSFPKCIMLESSWVEGKTVRAIKASPRAPGSR